MGQENSPADDQSGFPGAGQSARRLIRYVNIFTFLCLFALLSFGIGFAYFANYVTKLHPPSQLSQADGIIVLTGGQNRIHAGIELLTQNKGKRLLISGTNPNVSSKNLQKATGGSAALFKCCIDLDVAALNTIGNALESTKWIKQHNFKRVILVTNNYHIPRSMLEFERAAKNIDFIAWPVVNTNLENGEWLTKPKALRVLFTEYTKYLAAIARGYLSTSS